MFDERTDTIFDVNTLLAEDCFTFPTGTLPDIFSKIFSPSLNRVLNLGADPTQDLTVAISLDIVDAVHKADFGGAVQLLNEMNGVLGEQLGDGDPEVAALMENVNEALTLLGAG